MILVAINTIAAELRPTFKLVPIPTIERAIRQAAIMFCTGSWAVQELIEDIDVEAQTANIALVPTAGMVTYELIEAWYDGKELELTSERELAIDGGEWRKTYGIPSRIFLSGLNQVSLSPVPASAQTGILTVKIAVTPERLATHIPEILTETYWDVIRVGTEGIIMDMKNEVWADPDAGNKKAQFNAAIRNARNRTVSAGIRRNKTIAYGGI